MEFAFQTYIHFNNGNSILFVSTEFIITQCFVGWERTSCYYLLLRSELKKFHHQKQLSTLKKTNTSCNKEQKTTMHNNTVVDCIELTFERYYNSISNSINNTPIAIDWSLNNGGDFSDILASGTLLPAGGESGMTNVSKSIACWDHHTTTDCAELRINNNRIINRQEEEFYGRFQLRYNDVIWIDKPFDFNLQQPNYDVSSLGWIGNDCHKNKFQVCNYQNDVFLLDVALATKGQETTHNVYWRVYVHKNGGNLLHDPYFRKYKPNASYRTLQCVPDWGKNACIEFGLHNNKDNNSSSSISNLTLHVNGKKIRNEEGRSYYCNEGSCAGDIVTPLLHCSSSNGGAIRIAIISIIASAVVAVVLVLILVVWHFCRAQNHKGVITRPSDRHHRPQQPQNNVEV